MIQEYVPGKQVTLAHVLPIQGRICLRNWVYQTPFPLWHSDDYPQRSIYHRMRYRHKSGAVEIGFLDRFTGAVVLTVMFLRLNMHLARLPVRWVKCALYRLPHYADLTLCNV